MSVRTFPAPLVLPGDDLSLDPRYSPQSLNAWIREKDRNKVTGEKNVIYVAAPPEIDSDFEFIDTWSQLQQKVDGSDMRNVKKIHDNHLEQEYIVTKPQQVQDIADYLAAFYTGMPVKVLPLSICFTGWRDKRTAKAISTAPPFIGLNTSTECVRIGTRACPDAVFSRQLNLNDLLDAAMDMLPKDAYALLLIVDHDLYEDEDDEFICGRAYGGSRIAIISTARYNPHLDCEQGVELEHAWPASHCEVYVHRCCGNPSQRKLPRSKDPESVPPHHMRSPIPIEPILSPLQAAVTAHSALAHMESQTSSLLSGLWLGRLCRTASHELGHCFGLDHCVYYACVMQGSASLLEDARQPPYLCPIDLAKLLRATGADAEQRYLALLSYCEKHGDTRVFAAFAAWIRLRVKDLDKVISYLT